MKRRRYTCHRHKFKSVEITVEVSQKSAFQEMLKITHEDSKLLKIKMASIWPSKKSRWSLLMLIFLTMRPPEDLL